MSCCRWQLQTIFAVFLPYEILLFSMGRKFIYLLISYYGVISEDGESMEVDTTSGSKLPGAEEEKVGVGSGAGSDDKEMEAMLQNPEFLHSVLSSLPGVNPEEALQNLEEMSKVVEDQKEKKKKDGRLFYCSVLPVYSSLLFRRANAMKG